MIHAVAERLCSELGRGRLPRPNAWRARVRGWICRPTLRWLVLQATVCVCVKCVGVGHFLAAFQRAVLAHFGFAGAALLLLLLMPYAGLRTPPYARTSAATARPGSASRTPSSGPPEKPRAASARRPPAAGRQVHSPGPPPLTLPALPEAYTHRLERRRYLFSPEKQGRPERAQPMNEERQVLLCAAAGQTRTEGGRAIVSRKWWRCVGPACRGKTPTAHRPLPHGHSHATHSPARMAVRRCASSRRCSSRPTLGRRPRFGYPCRRRQGLRGARYTCACYSACKCTRIRSHPSDAQLALRTPPHTRHAHAMRTPCAHHAYTMRTPSCTRAAYARRVSGVEGRAQRGRAERGPRLLRTRGGVARRLRAAHVRGRARARGRGRGRGRGQCRCRA